jgi:hypothetical protein
LKREIEPTIVALALICAVLLGGAVLIVLKLVE